MPCASILILQPNKSSINQMLLHSYEANENPPRTSKDVQMQRDIETILQLTIGSITIYTCTHAILTTSNLVSSSQQTILIN